MAEHVTVSDFTKRDATHESANVPDEFFNHDNEGEDHFARETRERAHHADHEFSKEEQEDL